ncbi:GNAT family N-acetyltransferase [Roseateles sp. BYS180W]|uniref:GNAT family N-acetyltransferase n=1 Tax=Roseateles rivi TaxID=3299028 RepID=A0ABW7FW78_9BURK
MQTPLITLDLLTVAHAPALFPVLGDPAMYRHIDRPIPADLSALRQTLQRWCTGGTADGRERWFNWVVQLHQEGETPRSVGLMQATLDTQGVCWIGYMIGVPDQGRGLGRQAVLAMLQELDQHCAPRQVLACVEEENRRSIALIEHLGFERADAAWHAQHGLSATERLYHRPTKK